MQQQESLSQQQHSQQQQHLHQSQPLSHQNSYDNVDNTNQNNMDKRKKKRVKDDYDFLQAPNKRTNLGKGAYGCVRLARDKITDQLVAIKIMSKKEILEYSGKDNLKREIKIQRSINHPHIIKLLTYFEDNENVYLVLEYAEKGNLYQYLNNKKKLDEDEAFIYFFQTCVAVDYLHKKKIIHRDLKPENLLLDSGLNIKICDFGWSADDNRKKSAFCGTIDYMAPEMIKNQPHDNRLDIWCLGVLLYEMIQGHSPFKGKTDIEICSNIIRNNPQPFNPNVSPDAIDLIKRILKTAPIDRISMDQIFKHPWMKKFEKFYEIQLTDYITPIEEIERPRKLSISSNCSMNLMASSNIDTIAKSGIIPGQDEHISPSKMVTGALMSKSENITPSVSKNGVPLGLTSNMAPPNKNVVFIFEKQILESNPMMLKKTDSLDVTDEATLKSLENMNAESDKAVSKSTNDSKKISDNTNANPNTTAITITTNTPIIAITTTTATTNLNNNQQGTKDNPQNNEVTNAINPNGILAKKPPLASRKKLYSTEMHNDSLGDSRSNAQMDGLKAIKREDSLTYVDTEAANETNANSNAETSLKKDFTPQPTPSSRGYFNTGVLKNASNPPVRAFEVPKSLKTSSDIQQKQQHSKLTVTIMESQEIRSNPQTVRDASPNKPAFFRNPKVGKRSTKRMKNYDNQTDEFEETRMSKISKRNLEIKREIIENDDNKKKYKNNATVFKLNYVIMYVAI